MKYIMYEHIALSTKVIFAILTPIAIERTHPFTYVRSRHSLKGQCTRVTIRVRANSLLSGHPAKKKKGKRLSLAQFFFSVGDYYSHGRVRLDWEQVMITPCEVRRRYDHQAADVAVGRRVAEPRAAARTEKSCRTHLRVTYAERGRCRVGQSLREAHHHQVCAHLGGPSRSRSCSRSGDLLRGWRRYELEKEVFEVSFVQSDAERAYEKRNGGTLYIIIHALE
jgi:hypothetical protein